MYDKTLNYAKYFRQMRPVLNFQVVKLKDLSSLDMWYFSCTHNCFSMTVKQQGSPGIVIKSWVNRAVFK